MRSSVRASPLPSATPLRPAEEWFLAKKPPDGPDASSRSRFASLLGQRIRALRMERLWSGGELASRCGVSRSFLSRLERGLASTSFETLQSIGEALDTPLSRLVAFDEPAGHCVYVPAGRGLVSQEDGATSSLREELVGQLAKLHLEMTSRLLTLSAGGSGTVWLRNAILQSVHVLQGSGTCRHGGKLFRITAGDSMIVDSTGAPSLEAASTTPLVCLLVEARLRR